MKNKISILVLIIAFCGLSTVSFSGNIDNLTSACMKGDLAAAQKAIADGADVNSKDAVGWYPLGTAIFSPEITQLLLDKKADPNLGDSPALVNAAGVGSYEVMKLLLAAGADPNKPLIVDPSAAIQKLLDAEKAKGKAGNKYMVKAFEDQIKNMKAVPTKLYAIQRVVNSTLCKECLDLLIEKGAKTDVINNISGGNLLDDLAFSFLPANDWIENNKAQVGGWEKLGFITPAWYKNSDAAKLGTADAMVKALVMAGVNINAINSLKQTPLLTSLARFSQTKSEIIIALINNGSDINAESITMGHPLLQAAGLGFVDVLEALVAKGADLNREFKVDDYEKSGQRLKGITPLMWAARKGNLDAVKFLVAKGVKLNEAAYGTSSNITTGCLTSVKNKTAIFYAVEGANLDVVKYLVESTTGDWKKSMTIDKWKVEVTTTSSFGWYQTSTTTTTCFDDKDYTASEYAKASKLDEISTYLKSKGL